MEYSVVVPVFNSEDSLEELYARISLTLSKTQMQFEVIFVDDFSKDGSWKKLLKIKEANSERVRIIRFAKNYGQHNATFCGLKYVRGNYVITIDDDLQNSPEDILLLIDKVKKSNVDLVYGIEKSRSGSSMKKASSNFFKRSSKYMDDGLGEGSSFRLFNTKLLNDIINHNQHFIFLDELLFWYTNFIEYVPVDRYPRKHGVTGYTSNSLLKFLTSATVFYGTWPLRLMTYGGAFFSFLSFAVGVYFICKKILLGAKVPGFIGIMVAISFSTSIILMCFGIIGKYLSNIYVVLNNKPVYSIKDVRL